MPKANQIKIKVILTNRVRSLGKRGDVVAVRIGFFRNFLSNGLAVSYDAKLLQEMQASLNDTINEKHEIEAQKHKEILENQYLFFAKQASGTEILFASVSRKEITDEIFNKFNITVNPKKIFFKDVIKKIGIYDISIDLSEHVSLNMKLAVNQTIDSAQKMVKN